MDLAKPPDDIELRNIIDKLAQFVARNGPEFEMMTKNKQKDNPKFQFLFGGEYFNYYQCKVTTEQAIFKHQQQQGNVMLDPQSPPSWNTQPPAPASIQLPPAQPQVDYTAEIEQISQQQDVLREQIKQSEQNLNAQHTVLLQQQQAAVDAAVAKCESEELQRRVEDCGLILAEMHSVLQPIIDSCTKDSISHGKSWFLQRADTKEKAECIVQCFLLKTLRSATFPQKLHIIYLVNDLLHHSGRKQATEFKESLEIGVIPMFCNASIAATTEQHQKLDKLIKLWESKANYLKPETLVKLKKPVQSYQEYQTEQNNKYTSQVAVLSEQTHKTFEGYQAQHQAFVCHAMQQIMDLQQQKEGLEAQQEAQKRDNQPQPNFESLQASIQQTIQNLAQSNLNNLASAPPTPRQTFPIQQAMASQQPQPSTNESFVQMNPSIPPPLPPDISPHPTNGVGPQFTQPPPGYLPPPGMFPDFSKPPPGFPPKPEIFLEELVPSAPYYDLPAGLMVPLVKLEDTEYKPLDPKDIRLPPPAPPSERLLAAVDAFYAPPSHERPRDSEGWEKLGLYEYYKAKNASKREKEAAIAAGLRTKSRSPSPIILKQEKENTPPKRRYRSKSPTPPQTHSYSRRGRSRSRSRGRERERSRSRSRSPRRRRARESRDSRENRRRRSYSRSRSRSPPRRSRSRSISPPMTPGMGSMPFSRADQEIDSSNKGHQLLQKMGWGGRGLGRDEQGIDTPISGGDVRDRQDQFKGVGCNLNDPYENFRKNKGAAFITRMKARAEERDKDKDHKEHKEKEKGAKTDY